MEEKKKLLDQDERVVEIEMERLRGFVNHPFKVQADSQMIELQESIKKYGILNPLIVRPRQDPHGSLTISLGYEEPDEMEYSLATLMMNIVNDEKLNIEKTILHHKEGVDLIPANIELSAIEVSLVNAMSRELILRSMVDKLREFYDFIIIDCMPSLGMMTINALACADSVLIPVQAAYLPVKGLQQLIKTIGRVKKQLNPKLKIEGILLTMVDNRTNYAKDISLMVYDTYSASIKVFGTEIPMSVRASEVSVEGGSIYSYDPKGKAAFAYMALTKEDFPIELPGDAL